MRATARRRLRVLVTRCWGLGGGQVWAQEFANRLAGLGHDVRVVYLHRWWPRMRNIPDDGADKMGTIRYRPTDLHVPLFFEPLSLTRFLRGHLKREPADVIVSTGLEAAWLHAVRFAGKPPHVASFHHSAMHWVGLRGVLRASSRLSRRGIAQAYQCWGEHLDRVSMTHADQVVCSSQDQADRVVNKLEIPKGKVRVVYCGIDTNRLSPENGKRERLSPNVLYAGGLSLSKGLHVLLDAFARIRPRFPDARLSVLGDGHWAPYQQKVEALGLSQCVRYWGQIPHLEIGKHYRSACLLAAPTRHESFGLILAEAMACGLPVVATRVTAIPEVVEDGVTGLLVPVDDPTALAGALATVLSDPERAAAMGRAGRARVEERFAWDEIIRQWERLLFQVAEGETL